MSNINDYIKKYSDKTFVEEPFNEIDNLVFSMLTYSNFEGIVSNERKYITLEMAGKIFLGQNTFKDIKKYGIAQAESYNILKLIVDSKRYKNVLMYNYAYIADTDKQFGAISFKIKKDLVYVAFEGTDHLLSGWKEDFQMSYVFPVPAQEYAIKYLNNTIKLLDKNVIVGGHSKGGNLALVSSMYCKWFLRRKIKLIYSNDGQGLRKEQIESKNYNRIKDRYIHIIPNYSYIGILLRCDKHKVIKSSRRDILSHSILNWMIDDNKLIETKISNISKNLEDSMILWLEKHDDKEREKLITTIFKALEDSNIYCTRDLIDIRKSINIIKKIGSIDDETKSLVLSLLQFNLNYLLHNTVERR